MSNKSLNTVISADKADLAIRKDLEELEDLGFALLFMSGKNTVWPSCEEKLALFASEASEKPTTLFSSSCGIYRRSGLFTAYLTALFKFRT